MSLLRFPPVPRFDPKKDGNPFRWIVATAPMVRAQRQDALDAEALKRFQDRRAARLPRPQ
jgi:hypothetical protein